MRGDRLEESIPISAALSRARVQALVGNVARVIDRPARNARMMPKPLATGLRVIPSEPGLAVKRPQLERALTNALLRVEGASTLAVPTRAVHPRWWTSTLKQRYHTYILVSRETFKLRLYKHLKLVKTYGIAVGQQGLETPAGEYTINDKQVNPSWHVPNSAWAGALAGQIIPPGPADPIKARWLGFYNGAGIHGTDADLVDRHRRLTRLHPDARSLTSRISTSACRSTPRSTSAELTGKRSGAEAPPLSEGQPDLLAATGAFRACGTLARRTLDRYRLEAGAGHGDVTGEETGAACIACAGVGACLCPVPRCPWLSVP